MSFQRKKGDSMNKYINEEEALYRNLQKIVQDSLKDGKDEYSDDGTCIKTTPPKNFQLPKKLRGWFSSTVPKFPQTRAHSHPLPDLEK